MTTISFTFQGQEFVLDLSNGELLGSDGIAKQALIDAISTGIAKGGYGSGYSPIPPTEIRAPYYDAEQFALCMTELGTDFPSELQKYLPVWEDDAGEDATELPNDFLLVH